MGHRNSSAQCHDPGCLCLDGGGARGDTASSFALNAPPGDGQTLVRTEYKQQIPRYTTPARARTARAGDPGYARNDKAKTKATEGFLAALGMTTLKAKRAEGFSAEASGALGPRFGRQGDLGMTTVLPSGGGRSLRNVANGAGAGMLLFGIRFYQAIFAHLMPVGCKFYPSCSRYAAEAIERHGAARGARLALGRLWRCRPFTQGGFDPVPDAHEVLNGAAEAASLSANEAEGGARAEVSS